jgi:hypothetical protein
MNQTRLWAAVAGPALLLLAGCGDGLPPVTDEAAALNAVTAALDAWKAGKPVEALRERSPAVDFSDPAQTAGSALTDYKVVGQERAGQSSRVTVKMTIRTKDGATKERTTAYTVDAGKMIVIRPDF